MISKLAHLRPGHRDLGGLDTGMYGLSPAGLVESSGAGTPAPSGEVEAPATGAGASLGFPSYFGDLGLLVSPGQVHWGEGARPVGRPAAGWVLA